MADKELQRQELQAKQIVFSVTAAGTPLVPVAALVGSTAQASEEVRKLTQRLTAIYKVDSGQARQVAIQ